MVIIGISVGTRTSGIAIVTNKGLISWHTLSFKDKWSEKKGAYIMGRYEKYLKKHNATIVVLKIPRMSHHTEAILSLLDKIQSVINQHGCMVVYKTQAEFKTAIPHIKNSRDLMVHTATLYPVLLPEQIKELSIKNSYHEKMFEAVIIAHLVKQENCYPPN